MALTSILCFVIHKSRFFKTWWNENMVLLRNVRLSWECIPWGCRFLRNFLNASKNTLRLAGIWLFCLIWFNLRRDYFEDFQLPGDIVAIKNLQTSDWVTESKDLRCLPWSVFSSAVGKKYLAVLDMKFDFHCNLSKRLPRIFEVLLEKVVFMFAVHIRPPCGWIVIIIVLKMPESGMLIAFTYAYFIESLIAL